MNGWMDGWMAFLEFDECELMIRHVAVFVASFSHDRSRHHVSRGEIRRVICAQEGQKRPGGTRRAIVSSAAFGQIAVGGKTVGVCCREIESILHRSRSSRVQAMHLARAEMKSEDREQYIRNLKKPRSSLQRIHRTLRVRVNLQNIRRLWD